MSFSQATKFLKTNQMKNVAKELEECALNYKNDFKKVEEVCDKNPNIKGCIASVSDATNQKSKIKQANKAAKSLKLMEDKKLELSNLGIPYHITGEICRRVLDSDVEDSKEYNCVIHET